jgi:hypothetical protein
VTVLTGGRRGAAAPHVSRRRRLLHSATLSSNSEERWSGTAAQLAARSSPASDLGNNKGKRSWKRMSRR